MKSPMMFISKCISEVFICVEGEYMDGASVHPTILRERDCHRGWLRRMIRIFIYRYPIYDLLLFLVKEEVLFKMQQQPAEMSCVIKLM